MSKRVIAFVLAGFSAAAMAACAQWLGIEELTSPSDSDAGLIDARAVDARSDVPFDAMSDSGPPVCGTAQCSNCIDDDSDGFIDGADVHCIFSADNDESSFATGIPGDNIDPSRPDCFFDGNSGSGDDDCTIDPCCLLGTCGTDMDCSVSQRCIDVCAPATPAGCDCFGCCTICDRRNCKDILTIPGSTDGWDCDDLANLDDPIKCPVCTKVEGCGFDCDAVGQNDDCILCPGQSPGELPDGCNMQNECPAGRQVCSPMVTCPALQYCSNNCCVDTLSGT